MARLQDTDVLPVGRGNSTFKATFKEVADSVPATPAATTSARGTVQLADAAAVTAGTAGRVVDAAQLKATNDALTAATTGVITRVTGTAPITVSGTGTTRTVAVSAATTAAQGTVQLADAAAISAGTAGRVIDAAQLKTAIAGAGSGSTGGITTLTGTSPVSVTGTGTSRTIAVDNASTGAAGVVQLASAADVAAGTAGRVVDAAQLKAAAGSGSSASASETVKGIVQLATAAETTAGAINTKAVHPAGLKTELQKLLPLTGGTLTGNLILNSLPTQVLQAATKGYVDARVDIRNTSIKFYNPSLPQPHLMIAWGQGVTNTTGECVVTFPEAFLALPAVVTTPCFTPWQTGTGAATAVTKDLTKTNTHLYGQRYNWTKAGGAGFEELNQIGVFWIAIGHTAS